MKTYRIQSAILAGIGLVSMHYFLSNVFSIETFLRYEIGFEAMHEKFSSSLSSVDPKLSSKRRRAFNVMFGLYGDRKPFLDEWEVALKSVLLNAPLDADLNVHLITNRDASRAVRDRIHNSGIVHSLWRNQISIVSYNVEALHERWLALLRQKLRGKSLDGRVTLGGYYRLLAHQVLPRGTGPILYMDTDAVILANLNELWRNHVNETSLFQVSLHQPCSGFMVINVDKFDEFWTRLDMLETIVHGGDQSLVVMIAKAFPQEVSGLPIEWDTHMGHGHRPRPQDIVHKQNKSSMLHFNGAIGDPYFERGLDPYCDRSHSCKNADEHRKTFHKTWGLADYYIRVPWSWVAHFGYSAISFDGGQPLQFTEVNVTLDDKPNVSGEEEAV